MKYISLFICLSFFTPSSYFELCQASIKKNGIQLGQMLAFDVYEVEMRGYEVAICASMNCSSITKIKRLKSQGNGQHRYKYYSETTARHGFVIQAYDSSGKAIKTQRVLPIRQDD